MKKKLIIGIIFIILFIGLISGCLNNANKTMQGKILDVQYEGLSYLVEQKTIVFLDNGRSIIFNSGDRERTYSILCEYIGQEVIIYYNTDIGNRLIKVELVKIM